METSKRTEHAQLRGMSQDEFFAWQERQDRLYELVDGAPILPLK
jgi:hypothetical protein